MQLRCSPPVLSSSVRLRRLGPDDWLALSGVSLRFLAVIDRKDGVLWQRLGVGSGDTTVNLHDCLGSDMLPTVWSSRPLGRAVHQVDIPPAHRVPIHLVPHAMIHMDTPHTQLGRKRPKKATLSLAGLPRPGR